MNDVNYENVIKSISFAPKRTRLNIDVGNLVQHNNRPYKVLQVIDFESIIAIDLENGQNAILRIGELQCIDDNRPLPFDNIDLAEIGDKEWQIAEKRFSAIKPLLNQSIIGREEVEKRAQEVKVDPATLYRWIKRYKSLGVISALIPQKRGWKKGNNRIKNDAESIIQQVINDYYLTIQRPSVQKTIIEILRLCNINNITSPSPSTIRSRISQLTEQKKLTKRGYKEKANNKFSPTPGSFPNANYPLSVIQIDHTPVDIILVDDIYRKPVGRPWITLAIDVFSRMVTGYYLSFDPPSETSIAMCVANSILPKEEWLILHNSSDITWPVWGVPQTIHVDNGADFRSNNFQQSCLMYGIHLEFRPVRQPRYGGHIERMLGTLLSEIHGLPGTTFSSIQEREGYDSEKHAAMTKTEFEEWLVKLICKVYHQRIHSGIEMSPIRKWEIGIFGNKETPGVGLPPKPSTDRHTILLDFLPSFKRTIQTSGVTIEGLNYYAEALRPWINSTEPKNNKKRTFTFRRDPRDISIVWFFDPTLKLYFKIPFANQALPSMSIWEYQQAKERLKKDSVVNDHQILNAITELRQHVETSKEKTKKARRQAQRRKEHEKSISSMLPTNKDDSIKKFNSTLLLEDIQDFGDIA